MHELDLVVRPDGVALALGSTPFSDFNWLYFGGRRSGEVQIVDISDPADPRRLSRWSLIADSDILSLGGDPFESSFQGMGSFATAYAHSVRAADDGDTVYVSYWDAGVVKLDISDPSAPSVVGRTQYAVGDDGDAHSMFPLDVGGTRYLLQNDEDYDPDSPVQVRSSVTGAEWFTGLDMWWMPQDLQATGQIAGEVFDAGDGCQRADYAGADGNIAVVDTIDFFYTDLIDGWPEIAVPADQADEARVPGRCRRARLQLHQPGRRVGVARRKARRHRGRRRHGGRPDQRHRRLGAGDPRRRGAGDDHDAAFGASGRVPAHLRRVDGGGRRRRRRARVRAGGNVHGSRSRRRRPEPTTPRRLVGSQHRGAGRSSLLVVVQPRHRRARHDRSDRPSTGRAVRAAGQPFAQVWGVAVDPETGLIYASDIGSGLWIVRPTGDAVPSG